VSGTTWSKFYWSDWSSDHCLRACSIAARGLWMELLCIAAGHDPIGYVAVNGRSLSAEEIARIAGLAAPEVETLLRELERNGVFSRDRKGAIYSRRMIRDQKRAKTARKNGKNGGNPNLIKTATSESPVNPPLNRMVNTHEPEASYQKPEYNLPAAQPTTPARERGAALSRETLDKIEHELRKSADLLDSPAPSLSDLSPIVGLIDQGADLETEILPAIRAKPKRDARSWAWFIPQIQDFRARRRAAASAPMPEISTGPPSQAYDARAVAARVKQRILAEEGVDQL
jgi:DNA-binding Lrp family transcriptional regulator